MDESTAQSRHPDSLRQAFLWAVLPTLVLFLIAPSVGDAQQQVVTTHITSTVLAQLISLQPPSDQGSTTLPEGPDREMAPTSFTASETLVSEAVTSPISSTTPTIQTSNIIGRVTELGVAHTSYIYGTIQTTDFGNANLFLVNPSGFVFGPHGSFDVRGSVSFSTAQYLRLSDGVNSANFYANPASDGLVNSILVVDPVVSFGFLSSAAPAAYGFLTAPDPSATITVQGSALSVLPGQSISLVGGKVVIQGSTLPDGTVQPGTPVGPERHDSAGEHRLAWRVRCDDAPAASERGRYARLPPLGPSPWRRARASTSAARVRSLSKAGNSFFR